MNITLVTVVEKESETTDRIWLNMHFNCPTDECHIFELQTAKGTGKELAKKLFPEFSKETTDVFGTASLTRFKREINK